MRSQCLEACIGAIFLVAARATSTIMVDDSDPGIEYRGAWVHNPIDDPKDLNYAASMTFTNVSGSFATYKFRGTGIAVFGAFEVAGTFAMQSSYSIDGGTPTDFMPASTIVKPAYRQKFFQSDALSDGEHTLIITNTGREFWFDYVLVTQSPLATTTLASSTTPQKAQTPVSTAQAALPTTDPAASSSAAQPGTTQAISSPSSQIQSTLSLSNTENVTLTSMNTAVAPPLQASTASESQTSISASGVASPTSTPAHTYSSKFPAGAIAGVATAAFLVLLLVGLVIYRWRRRKQVRRRDGLTPYDPGMTALAFEPSEKQDLAQDNNSGGSAATSLLLSLIQPAPVCPRSPGEIRVSRSSSERGVPHEIQTTNLDGMRMRMDRNRLTGFEPLGSPSSASPLLARHPRGTLQHKGSPVTSSAGPSSYMSPVDERRRSVDGGVRVAGGPPGNVRQDPLDDADDVRSGLSTLPPSYKLYPAA